MFKYNEEVDGTAGYVVYFLTTISSVVGLLSHALGNHLVHLRSGQGTGVVDLLAHIDVLDVPADSEGLLQRSHLVLCLG